MDTTFWRSASDRLPDEDSDDDEFTVSGTSVDAVYDVLPDEAMYMALVTVPAETISLNETDHAPVPSWTLAELSAGAVVSGVKLSSGLSPTAALESPVFDLKAASSIRISGVPAMSAIAALALVDSLITTFVVLEWITLPASVVVGLSPASRTVIAASVAASEEWEDTGVSNVSVSVPP